MQIDVDGCRWMQMDVGKGVDICRKMQIDEDGCRWMQMDVDGCRWMQIDVD